MTDGDHLLEAVRSHPEDDPPRLAFADWRDEQGAPARAEFIRVQVALARLTGRAPPRWQVPYPVALLAAYVSEFIADVFTRVAPAATITGVRLTRRRMHFDPSRSLAELGLQPRPVQQSLADALAWFREQGWVS